MVLGGGLSLGRRIALLVVLGLGVVLSLFGFLSLRALRESSDRALHERLVAAELTARHVDDFLDLYLGLLGQVAESAAVAPGGTNRDLEERLLPGLRGLQPLLGEEIALVGLEGRVIWSGAESPGPGAVDPLARAAAAQSMGTGRAVVSDAFSDGPGRFAVALAVPVPSREGQASAAVVALLDLSDSRLDRFVEPVSLGETGYAEIVDSRGLVLAGSERSRLFQKSDHTDQFAGLIRVARPTVGGCHSCHQEGSAEGIRPDVLAFAPLSVAPWGVALRQLEEEALGPTRELQRSLLAASALSLLVALGIALVAGRGLVRPLLELTAASRRIAAGDLERRVNRAGPAEIGELARAFDEMRERLRASLGDLEKANSSLEIRVAQRTRELSTLLEKVIGAQEEERRRVARELHDDTCQSLAALALCLADLEERLPESAQSARSGLARANLQVRSTLAGVRALALALRPSVLDDLGLVMAIDWYAKEQVASRGVEVKLEMDELLGEIPPVVETALFRIAQEALSNVVKHSGASAATVRLRGVDSTLVLEVEDEGTGFDVERALGPEGPRESLGLRGMIERATLSGGVLRVESSPEHGTRVRAELPLQRVG